MTKLKMKYTYLVNEILREKEAMKHLLTYEKELTPQRILRIRSIYKGRMFIILRENNLA